MSNLVLNVDKISKKFGDDNVALENVDFSIKKGEIFGFLGPSGSGKTTTINILTKQLRPDNGRAYIFDKPIGNLSSSDFKSIGIMSDNSGFYEKLSLYDNLKVFAQILKADFNYLDFLLKELDLYEDRDKKAENMSTGMKKRMLLIRALINKPRLVFLDEPTSGLDPNTTKKVHSLLEDIKSQGTTVFFTTHDMEEAEKMCDRLVLLNRGFIVAEGTPTNIIYNHTKNKNIEITFKDMTTKIIPFEKFDSSLLDNSVFSIHSCEPSLEQVFIDLTGEALYE